MRVGTEQTEVGQERLCKRVVTQKRTQTVPVSHEEVRIEREPITEPQQGDAMDVPSCRYLVTVGRAEPTSWA